MLPQYQINKLSEYKLEQLLVALCNLQINQFGRVEIVSSYRASKFSQADLDYQGTAEKLREKYGFNFNHFSGERIWVTLDGSSRVDVDTVLDGIYEELYLRLSSRGPTIPEQKEVALALYGLRGSADFTLRKYAVDLNFDDARQIERLQNLIRTCPGLDANTTLNPKRGSRRPQFRTNLPWIYDNLAQELSQLNSYKESILENNRFRV